MTGELAWDSEGFGGGGWVGCTAGAFGRSVGQGVGEILWHGQGGVGTTFSCYPAARNPDLPTDPTPPKPLRTP